MILPLHCMASVTLHRRWMDGYLGLIFHCLNPTFVSSLGLMMSHVRPLDRGMIYDMFPADEVKATSFLNTVHLGWSRREYER